MVKILFLALLGLFFACQSKNTTSQSSNPIEIFVLEKSAVSKQFVGYYFIALITDSKTYTYSKSTCLNVKMCTKYAVAVYLGETGARLNLQNTDLKLTFPFRAKIHKNFNVYAHIFEEKCSIESNKRCLESNQYANLKQENLDDYRYSAKIGYTVKFLTEQDQKSLIPSVVFDYISKK